MLLSLFSLISMQCKNRKSRNILIALSLQSLHVSLTPYCCNMRFLAYLFPIHQVPITTQIVFVLYKFITKITRSSKKDSKILITHTIN